MNRDREEYWRMLERVAAYKEPWWYIVGDAIAFLLGAGVVLAGIAFVMWVVKHL